jgi:23S rRNA (cytosine1962-C5)-methyltransferase
MKEGVVLKKGKEVIFENRHQWIFSGAVYSFPKEFTNGSIYPVYSSAQQLLGHAYFNKSQSLCGRILSFGDKDPQEEFFNKIEKALELRRSVIDLKQTNAYRLINGEGDGLPGLIVDQYHEYLVIQSGTLGMDMLMQKLTEYLVQKGIWKGIFEKSTGSSRKEEKLAEKIGVLFGEDQEEILIKENGLCFQVNWRKGQKTGFFLDQREMRHLIKNLSCDKKVLNCFSYSGGFSVYALAGHAKFVHSVDISEQAIAWVEKNCQLNGFDSSLYKNQAADAFNFLNQNPLDYDIIILDPPAFAKKKQDIPKASRGYREINTQVLRKMPSKSLLLTCSCSYYMEESLFQTILFQAAKAAKREVQILSKHLMGIDHPFNIYHPEINYLKSYLLYVH